MMMISGMNWQCFLQPGGFDQSADIYYIQLLHKLDDLKVTVTL